jgi:hypothetical protein
VPFRLYFSVSSSLSDKDGSLRMVVRNFPVFLGGDGFGGEGDRWNGE